MARSILVARAILLYGSLVMASGVASAGTVQSQDGLTKTQDSVMLQKMSEEERERRVQICEREFEYCRDWCNRQGAVVRAMKIAQRRMVIA